MFPILEGFLPVVTNLGLVEEMDAPLAPLCSHPLAVPLDLFEQPWKYLFVMSTLGLGVSFFFSAFCKVSQGTLLVMTRSF